MAAGDEEPGGGPPPPSQTNAADKAETFVPALKRASITSPFAGAECQDDEPAKTDGLAAPSLPRSTGGKAGSGGHGGGGGSGGADAELGRRRRRYRRSPWLSAPMILGTEIATNITVFSVQANLVVYLNTVLERSKNSAAMIAQLINGTSYLTVLLGGYLADAVLGRGKTVLLGAGLASLGLMLLTISAGVAEAMASHSVDVALFLAAEGCIALAFGGIKPNVSPLGADQFDDFDECGRPLNDKERFFGWYYFFINVGALLAATLLVWVQTSVSWPLGFALPTAISLVALAAFVAGWRGYRLIPPGMAPLRRITQVLVLAIKKRHLPLPDDPLDLYEQDQDSEEKGFEHEPPPLMHTPTMRWLDRAAVVPPGLSWPLPHEPPPTQFVSVTQVEETKQMIRLMPILLTFLVWNLCYAQLGTVMVQQAESMDRMLGRGFEMPAASITIFSTLTILFLVPLWDRALRPALERRGWAPTTLQRCGASQVLMAASMAVASAVEAWRQSCKLKQERMGVADPHILVLWLIPQIVVLGVSEFFFIGAIEFFYQQAPERMRSLASSLELVNYGIASYIAAGLVGIVGARTDWLPGSGPWGDGRLERYYALLAALAAVNAAIFVWPVAALYRYREFVPPVPLGGQASAPAICHMKSMVSMPATRAGMAVTPRAVEPCGLLGVAGMPSGLPPARASDAGGLRASTPGIGAGGGGGGGLDASPAASTPPVRARAVSAAGGPQPSRSLGRALTVRARDTIHPYASRDHRAARFARAETARSLSRRVSGSPWGGGGGGTSAGDSSVPARGVTPPTSARSTGRTGGRAGSARGGGVAMAALEEVSSAEGPGGSGGGGGGGGGGAGAPPPPPPADP